MADGAAEGGPTAGWASGALRAVQEAEREIARQTAVRARAVAAFAVTRPASADRPAGTPGAMGEGRRAARPAVLAEVSEWAGQELALALEISSEAAHTLLERSLVLVHRLPRTLAALESGALHVGHLFPMLERVGPIAEDVKRAEVEAGLLRWAAGRVTTPAQLAARARRLGLLVDARDSARRLAEAVRRRGVFARPDQEDGMAQLVALLTVPEAAALVDALGRYADALDEPGDQRTRGEKMADCLVDLVLRPGENGLAPVQAHLTVVAAVSTLLGGDQPGEIAGHVVPAELVRALARALGLLPDDDASPGADPAEDHPSGVPLSNLDTRRRTLAGLDVGDPGVSPLERELGTWWREVEGRVVREQQADAEGPVWEYVPRHHPGRGQRHEPSMTAAPPAPQPDSPSTAADEAVAAAGRALLEFDRAVGRARGAVRRAQVAAAADEAAWRDSTNGRVSAAADSLEALAEAGGGQRAALARLLDATAGGALAERPRVAVVDALTGALLALTDSRELRRTAGRGLGSPSASPGYRPGAALDRFLRARDRRCRFPGCRRPVPRGGQLDHDRPWPDGPTSATNLVGYCTPHHRGKHQAPGWRHELAADATLTVTTPSGLRAVSTPPPF
ncbi:DUF222 domain-containing protein [Blastococcus sp. SYSU D01042]